MTENQWLKSNDPVPMLACLTDLASCRKLALFACASCRGIPPSALPEDLRGILETLERYLAGTATAGGALAITRAPWSPVAPFQGMASRAVHAAARAALSSEPDGAWKEAREARAFVVDLVRQLGGVEARAAEWRRQAHLLREIFGNPFRLPELPPAWHAWNDGTVVHILQAVEQEQDYAQLTILGDALEDAGCRDVAVLAHCRQTEKHVRGCWVVDLLFSRA